MTLEPKSQRKKRKLILNVYMYIHGYVHTCMHKKVFPKYIFVANAFNSHVCKHIKMHINSNTHISVAMHS
jgi:hypothetical protein